MKKLRCLIIDDKPLAIDVLTDYVSKVPFLALSGTATDPIIGLQLIREQLILFSWIFKCRNLPACS